MRYALLLIMLLPALASGAESFGRLFTTPAERATLDHLRETRKIETVNVEQPEAVIEQAPTTPPEISVQGYVKRSDGQKGTVWVNEKPVQENSSSGDMEIGKLPKEGNQVQIKVPSLGKNLKLKAGQVYDPETGTVSESNIGTAHPNAAQSGTIGAVPGEKP
ncbi:MAG TPA: hypothetical protein VFS17_01665 [Methylophilaceae bacterium]|nr:hypothetical protein [Methylophilaceae bacterium]